MMGGPQLGAEGSKLGEEFTDSARKARIDVFACNGVGCGEDHAATL